MPPASPKPIHPGAELGRRLTQAGLRAAAFADLVGLPAKRVKKLLKGKQDLTAAMALRLGSFFADAAEGWLLLQMRWDLARARRKVTASALAAIRRAAKPGTNKAGAAKAGGAKAGGAKAGSAKAVGKPSAPAPTGPGAKAPPRKPGSKARAGKPRSPASEHPPAMPPAATAPETSSEAANG